MIADRNEARTRALRDTPIGPWHPLGGTKAQTYDDIAMLLVYLGVSYTYSTVHAARAFRQLLNYISGGGCQWETCAAGLFLLENSIPYRPRGSTQRSLCESHIYRFAPFKYALLSIRFFSSFGAARCGAGRGG